MYFEIEDESKIGVEFKLLNLFGKHSVVCENLRLKPQIVNTKEMMVIVKQCKIHRLQIVIDSSKQELLSAKVTGVYLSLKFNQQVQLQSPTKTLEKPQIQQFKKIISAQESFQKIDYFQSSPFKRMIMEQLLRKINVNIQNIDICLFYSDSPNAKCVGINLNELNICQRQVINRSKNGQHQKQQEIECKVNGLGMYLGISVGDNDMTVRENFHKQVIKQRQTTIRKRFFLQKNDLAVYYNQGNNTLSVLSELIEFNMSAFYVREFFQIVNRVKPLMSKSPKIRPGQGKKLTSGKYTFSQGTAEWWKYIGMNLVEKIKQKQQSNIIQNRQYRLYLYCLLYCYTFGGQTIYLNYIENAQKFKKPKHIMNSHKFIIQKIYKIQHKHLDHLEEMELRGFVSFLSMKPKKKENHNNVGKTNGFLVGNNIWQDLMKLSQQKTLKYDDVKKIKYEDIKKSKVFINFSNCVKFMTEYQKQSRNILSVFLRLRLFKLSIVETKQEIKMHKEMYAEHPQHFHLVKNQMMETFYLEHIRNGMGDGMEQETTQQQGIVKIGQVKQKQQFIGKNINKKVKEQKIINKKIPLQQSIKNDLIQIISFTIEHTNLQLMQNRFSLTIGHIKARQQNCRQKIMDIKNIALTNIALEKYSQKQGRIISVGNQLDFRIVSVYVNFTVKTAQKLLMIYTLIMDKLNGQQNTQESSQTDHNFVSDIMSKKIKPDLIFSNHNQSIHALIQSITLVTPTFDKDRIFHISLNKLQCDYPSLGTKTISLQRIQVKRSSFQNLKNQGWKKLGENESIILQNDRSFTVLISDSYTQKVDPQYFNFVKSFSAMSKQNKPTYSMRQKIEPMIEHDAKSVFNLIIPFLFVQLACEDVYYMMLVGKYWSQLMRNPYIFKPKLKTKQALQQVNKSSQLRNTTYQFIKQIQKNTKILFQTHITLNGFEFIFNGDKGISEEDEYTGKNRILTVMIDSICYDSQSKLKDDISRIKIKNMYVRNMLGNDQFNIQGLQDIFKQYIERKQPLIQRKSNDFLQQSFLIMYNHYMEDFQVEDKVPFLDITITNQMNIEKLRGRNDISINVKAFQIFHEPKFMRTIVNMINKLSLISQKHYEQSRNKFFQKSFIRENNEFREFQMQEKFMMQNKEILYSKDFSIINSMSVNIEKVNLIVLLENDPVYCIALDTIAINHKTESYITVYNIKINELYIMDVSIASGPHSMIIESTIPIHVNFTQYNCQLLKQRYKRSALMTIEINRAIIHFLNKKVMEFINFINQLTQDIFGKPQPSTKKAEKQNVGEYPFCYEIIIVDSKLVLYRNSLSKQKLQGRIGTLTVTNYKSRNFQQTMKRKTTTIFNRQSSTEANFMGKNNNNRQSKQSQRNINSQQSISQNVIDETHYQQMSQMSQNHFKSFLQESFEQQISDYIYIDIYSLTIDGRHRRKDILFADKMHMTFRDIYFKIFIPQINLSIDNDDFRLLIRLTQENFGQQDRFFHINPIFKTQKHEKFVTQFHIVVTKMECYKGDYGVYQGKDIEHSAQKNQNQPQQQSANILTLVDLRGKDVSFINGQKYDEIEIEKIFAEDQNMNQFIQRYHKSQDDPIINVKPKTIAHSQKYFSKFSKVFQLFSKLGQQGELVLSDFDYKQEEILHRPDRGKIVKLDNTQQASNCDKLMKWLRGMCNKCFWWTKKQMQEVSPLGIAKALLDKQVERRRQKDFNMVNQHTLFCNGDYNLSHIFNDKQMIRLQNKVTPQTFYPLYDPKYPNQIYFRMDMETTKDKKMYILAKDLIMSYDPRGGLLDLAQFFGKPYGAFQDYDPPFVASNFNNFRPAQMYMQLKDSKMQMKKQIMKTDDQNFEKIQSVQKIVIFLDLIYNMQTMGDMIKGPGRSIKQADIIFKLCHSTCKQGRVNFTQLSNLIEIIYRNQANVSYKKQDKTKFDEKIIMKPYFDKDQSVNFYIPAFSIKSLMEIYNANFNSKKQQEKDKEKIESQEDIRMDRRQSYDSTKARTSLKETKQQKVPKTQQLASKIDEKKQKIKQKDVQSSITNRKIYLQSLCINIESKIRTSFIKLYTKNLMFVNIYQNLIYTQKSKMELNSQLAIDYWNLHLLEFQPFLQPWNSKLIMKNIKRENTLSKKIKLESFNRALEVDNYQQKNRNNNWLNLNLSMAFFHTFKQLQLKYYQSKDQREQQCIDATFPQIQNLLKLPYRQSQNKIKNALKQFVKKQNFPQAMKNFFGRRFILQSQAIRKKGENRENFFHEYGTVYNLYHSYFDHQKRKKTICYRTPFRVLNCFSDHVTVRTKIKHNSSTLDNPKYIQFEHQLKKGEYLALPALIYKLDFLISFEYAHRHHQFQHQALGKNQIIDEKKNQQQIVLDEQDQDRFLSAQYLMQVHSQKSEFRKDKNSKILKKLFSQDSKKDRYLDSRDILIQSGKKVFALVCTKSEYDNDKQRSKIRFYDTLLAIVTPIQLYNYCPLQLTVILNGKNEYRLPCNRSTYISSQLNVHNIHETVIEFRQHILHREFTFLKKQNENHTYYMQLDRMQSVNVRVIKQTTSTFSIEIYADWILENHTEEEFQIDYQSKIFPLDRLSTNSIAIENYHHGKKIQLQISLYSPDNTKHFGYEIVTNATQAVEIITLYKKVPQIQKIKLLQRKRNLKVRGRCCMKTYPFTEKTKQKQSDQIYKVYSFVMKIANYQHCKLTKTLSIGYKTKMKNTTNKMLTLFQYDDRFKIQQLKPDQQICVWMFDFLPQYFVVQKKQMVDLNQQINNISIPNNISQPFRFDQSLGKTFTIRFRQSNSRGSTTDYEYHRYFTYIKIEIMQHDHCSLYQFTEIDANSSDDFPIYIHNTTEEMIKIYENTESFYVKPRSKVPFSWSNLIDNKHQIDVEINEVKKTYSFKNNQQFQPIIIKDEHVQQHNKPTIQQPKTNFHKQVCRVKYGLIQGKFQTIIDIKQNCLIILPGLQGIEYKFDMKQAVKMTISAQSIELNLGPKKQPLILYPSNQTFQTWLSYLNYTINQDIVSKISFTIQTYKNSRLFFFHNVQLGRQNDYLTSSENYFIQNLYISVINDKPQQVILLYLGEITFQRDNRICRLGYDDYQIQKCDRKLEVKEIKINNQLQNAVNPVILTQIKKSKTPFISIITKKRNLVKSKEDLEAFQFRDEMITHFQSFRFFLDEAQAMVEASLIPKLLGLKNQMERVQTQYKIEEQQEYQSRMQRQQTERKQRRVSNDNKSINPNIKNTSNKVPNKPGPQPSPSKQHQQNKQNQQSSYQIYMSFLQIRPIKMTVSVSFDTLSRDQQQQRMNMQLLNMLPVGIENAIITIDSYMFHHIYEDKQQVMKQIKEFYKSQLTKQVLINAGNLEFLFAVDLIKNLGIGVKTIFYDPIYEFASNKDIKNTTSTLLQGVFSFILFIISFFVKIVNLVFKIFAISTFDTDYKAKREIFRKQIFKSPLDGMVFGGKYFWKIFKSVKEDFVRLPKIYNEKYSIIGCFFGFILAILNIIPWLIKLFITIYDMIYVIGIGFVSWGHYEQNAMKNRSRPIRIFHKKKLVPYNLLQAKAYEIMRKHNIELTEKQSILYVRDVDSMQKTTSYLILSDYSLLYCNNRLSMFDEIILYKVFQFRVIYPEQKKKPKAKSVSLQISLKSPNIRKFLFLQFTKYTYVIKFKCYQQLLQLLDKLQQLKDLSQHNDNRLVQKYDYSILDDKKMFNKEEIKKMRKRQQPLEYKEMDYLQDGGEQSEDAILEQFQINNKKKKQIAV